MNEETEKVAKPYSPKNVPDILGALILITLGVLLLLNNIQVLPWSIWFYIGRFWPAIFVFLGLNMISANSFFFRFIATFIGVLFMLFILTYALYNSKPNFKSYIDNAFPGWKKIYNSIPSNVAQDGQKYYVGEPNTI